MQRRDERMQRHVEAVGWRAPALITCLSRTSSAAINHDAAGHAVEGSAAAGAARSPVSDTVLRLLLALKPATDARQQALVLRTLHAMPTIRPSYLRLRTSFGTSLEPRAARQWFSQLAFICRVARVCLGGGLDLGGHAEAASALQESSVGGDPQGGAAQVRHFDLYQQNENDFL